MFALFVLTPSAGCTRRKQVVETLSNPVPVLAIWEDALMLPKKELLPIPGGPFSQSATIAIWEATRSGVELDARGRPIGLLRLHHWCKTDSIGRHISRVPIAELAQFVEQNGLFQWSEYGWNYSQYFSMMRGIDPTWRSAHY